jgi:hypothetical protein
MLDICKTKGVDKATCSLKKTKHREKLELPLKKRA